MFRIKGSSTQMGVSQKAGPLGHQEIHGDHRGIAGSSSQLHREHVEEWPYINSKH